MPSVNFIRVHASPPDTLHGAWNEESYLGDTKNLVTQVFGVDIKGVVSGNNETRRLLRIGIESDFILTEVVGPYPTDGFTKPEPIDLRVIRKISRMDVPVTATDLYWSSATRLLYVYDANRAMIYALDPLDESSDSIVNAISIDLPAKISLDERSRLAVLEIDLNKPEDLDPLVYISAPASGAILQVSLQTGGAQVICAGRLGGAEIKQIGKREPPPNLKEPTAIIVDQTTGRLIIADDANSSIYGLDRSRKLFRIARLPSRGQISAMLLYRTARYIDSRVTAPSKLLIEDGTWGGMPTYLLASDVLNHQVYKVALHVDEKKIARLTNRIIPGVVRLHDMQNGDLLLLRREKDTLCLHTTHMRLSAGFSAQES